MVKNNRKKNNHTKTNTGEQRMFFKNIRRLNGYPKKRNSAKGGATVYFKHRA